MLCKIVTRLSGPPDAISDFNASVIISFIIVLLVAIAIGAVVVVAVVVAATANQQNSKFEIPNLFWPTRRGAFEWPSSGQFPISVTAMCCCRLPFFRSHLTTFSEEEEEDEEEGEFEYECTWEK